MMVRLGLGTLLAANLVAAVFVLKPWASSVEELEQQASSLRQQVQQRERELERLRAIVDKVETARSDGDRFEQTYLLSKRSMASALVQELVRTAQKAGMRQKETAFAFEPVEGSESLTKVTITGIFEGTYADLMEFLNLLDRSERFLIIESLAAALQQSGLTLGDTLKLCGFVREGGEPPAEAPEVEPEPPARAAAEEPQPAAQAGAPTAVQAAPPAPAAPAAVSSPGPARGFLPRPPRRMPGAREIQ